jgi:hypothetical protein
VIVWMSMALAGFGLDRIDVLSEDPGTFLSSDVPKIGRSTTVAGIRFVEQVKPVFTTPVDGLLVGLSLATQSVYYEQPVWRGLGLTGGVQTRLGLPRGVLMGGYLRTGPLRLGVGANVLSGATWTRPDFTVWRVMPGVGVGIGPRRHPRMYDI